MIIAIDGPAASGKGTLGRKIAAHYNLAYMDTGALYRAVAHKALDQGLSVRDRRDVVHAAQEICQKIAMDGPEEILANPALRSDEVGNAASHVAAMKEVREALLDIQRNFAANPPKSFAGAVLDGRDIGTVICPQADVKIFVTASLEIRAQRRLKELQSIRNNVTYDTVLADMRHRDERDSHTLEQHTAAGYKTNVLDTSDLDAEAAFRKALVFIDKT